MAKTKKRNKYKKRIKVCPANPDQKCRKCFLSKFPKKSKSAIVIILFQRIEEIDSKTNHPTEKALRIEPAITGYNCVAGCLENSFRH